MDTGQLFMNFTPTIQIVYLLNTLANHILNYGRPHIKPTYILISYTVKNKNLFHEKTKTHIMKKPIQLKTKYYIVKNSKKTISIR
jgi:hypothetical protein